MSNKGFLGTFSSLVELERSFPARAFPGRGALIGEALSVSQYFSTGSVWQEVGAGGATGIQSVVYLGDSRFGRSGNPAPADYSSMVLPLPTSTSFPTLASWNDRGLVNWMQACTLQRLRLLRNAGVGGNRVQHMRARLQADVLSLNPGYVVVLAGYNNIINDDSFETIIADLGPIYDDILASGAGLVALTELPVAGVFGVASRLATWNRLNKWIRDYCRDRKNAKCVDASSSLSDPISGDPLASIYSDAIHPVMRGAQLFGAGFAKANPFEGAPESQLLTGSNKDVISTLNPAGNIVLNGLMAGTTGVNSGAGISGTVATSWTHQLEYGSATSVASKIARTDGRPGDFQQVAISAINGAVRLQQTRSVAAAGYAVGDVIRCFVELAIDAATSCDTLTFTAQVQNASFADIANYSWNLNSGGSSVQVTDGVVVASIPDFTVPALTNHIIFKVITASAAGSVSFRVGTVDCRKVE